jgi:hypothetical protein
MGCAKYGCRISLRGWDGSEMFSRADNHFSEAWQGRFAAPFVMDMEDPSLNPSCWNFVGILLEFQKISVLS